MVEQLCIIRVIHGNAFSLVLLIYCQLWIVVRFFFKHYCPFSINWGHISMLAEDRGSGGNMCLPMVLNVVFPMLMCWTSLLNQLGMHILVDLKEIILHLGMN